MPDKFTLHLFLLLSVLSTMGFVPQPRPLTNDGLRDPIFVCRESDINFCNPAVQRPGNRPIDGQVVSYSPYIEQVLANEWHGSSSIEAFKVGAIAIRTFADRELGCGAQLPYAYSLGPGLTYGMVSNISQAYWRFNSQTGNWEQTAVNNNHRNARSQTDGVRLYRDDGSLACVKYFANTGSRTHSCENDPSHFQCPNGSSDRATLRDVPDPVSKSSYINNIRYPGISQNGTTAWGKGNVPWDYRQMLTHYLNKVRLTGSSDSYYRWTWLNVGNTVEHTGSGGYEYYGTINPTPACVYLGGSRPVSLRIQNTSRQTWDSSVKLSYRWYNGSTLINQGPEFSVPSLAPGTDATINASISPPSGASVGSSYSLRWDMKRGSTWFSSQNNWPTLNSSVCIQTDSNPPSNPPSGNISSPSGHIQYGWSALTQITLAWSGASDGETGVSGYSIAWDQNSATVPDTTQDTSGTTASATLGHGMWYLHVRTRDNAGNWAGSATHYGPYGVDTTPPTSQVSNSPATPGKSWLYLNVSGTDTGSGIGQITIQYQIDGGGWQNYTTVNGTGPHTVLFVASRYNRGHTYVFRTQAIDQVGLAEAVGVADFSIVIAANADPTGLLDWWMPLIFK